MQDEVSVYYEKNTTRFLRFGGGGDVGAIHRKVWAPEVKTKNEAFLYVNKCIEGTIQDYFVSASSPLHIVDLGCGVGGTALWLSEHLNAFVTGISNSPLQVHIAQQKAINSGLEERCKFLEIDFHQLPDMKPFHVAVAIESYTHSDNPEQFLTGVKKNLFENGLLIICDDFVNNRETNIKSNRTAKRWIQRFERGWHIRSLTSVEETRKLLEDLGFRLLTNRNFSVYLRRYHPVLQLIMRGISILPFSSPLIDNFSGGTSLQHCIKKGWIEYNYLVWVKNTGTVNFVC